MTESEMIYEILLAIREEREEEFYLPNRITYIQAKKTIAGYKLSESRSAAGGKISWHILTERGHEALKAGGFDKWRAANEKKEAEIHQATLATAKATVDAAESAKWSKYAAIVSAIAAIIAFVLPPLLQKRFEVDANKTDSTVSVLKKKVDTVYWQLKVQSQSLKAIKDSAQRQKTKIPSSK